MYVMFRSPARLFWNGVLVITLFVGSTVAAPSFAAPSMPTAQPPVVVFNILPIKPGAFARFLPVMQANAAASRKEWGNQAFDVFQPEDGASKLYLLERWASQAAVDKHFTQPNLKAVLKQAETDFADEAPSLRLVAVPGLGPESRKPFTDETQAAGSRNVFSLLTVKPGQEKTCLRALTEAAPHVLRAPGNHAFEVYRVESQPNTYLLFERWASVTAHEAHLSQAPSTQLHAVLQATLEVPLTQANQFLVKDVAEG